MNKNFNRSCLRWPGNKFSLLSALHEHIPSKYNNYHEPFLGSGSVLLNIDIPNHAYISDLNPHLINFYMQLKNEFDSFVEHVIEKKNEETYFYSERNKIYECPVEQAAQFYYLNRTCFNGIYRVNSSGKFNVPYGKRESTDILDLKNLNKIKMQLEKVTLNCFDFYKSIELIQEDDFIFLDPPYSSKTSTNTFLMYNEVLFSWNDQLRLKEYCQVLIEKGTNIIMTNLFNQDVYSLFAEELKLNCTIIERYSRVGSKINSRGIVKEYLFTNIID